MNFISEQIVWQEVPGEVSLAFTISGCPLRCPGCHSTDSWSVSAGKALSQDYLASRLALYEGLISCVVFLGGEWLEEELLSYLALAKEQGLKTCLYSGLEDVSEALKAKLTYLKIGPWRRELGGLDSPHTNQRFIDLRTDEILNRLFQNQ